MLTRLRYILGLLVAAAIGYAVARSALADYADDLVSMARIAWAWYRLKAGTGGTVSILIAGILLGQGMFFAIRRLVATIGPKMAEWEEEVAQWDAAYRLPTRFGVQRYLDACVRWAVKESPDSAPSIALFKISGLGLLNERRGTRVTTELLRAVADEARDMALPPAASAFSRFLVHHRPRPPKLGESVTPPPRCAARWSGSTVALAFRGLELHQAVTVAREFAEALRAELASVGGADVPLGLRVAIAGGRPGASARTVGDAAAAAVTGAPTDTTITVALDPEDRRAGMLTELPDVRVTGVSMDRLEQTGSGPQAPPTKADRLKVWAKAWGAAVVCLAAAPVVLQIGAGNAEFPRLYVWPSELAEFPVVEASGVSQVKVVRSKLPTTSGGGWKLTGQVVQADPANSSVKMVQIWVEVTNLSDHARYVSTYDFAALDADGKELSYEPKLVLRYEHGLDGRWVGPGESSSGWLVTTRKERAVTGLLFRPSRETRLVARVAE